MTTVLRQPPGRVRDAIIATIQCASRPLTTTEIVSGVQSAIAGAAHSSIRSYLRLNTPGKFIRVGVGTYALADSLPQLPRKFAWSSESIGQALVVHADCFEWLAQRDPNSVHAVVTDPPYGVVEYTEEEQAKRRSGRGGVWRVPPSLDGYRRSPVPRFTTLSATDLDGLDSFFERLAVQLNRILVPGGHLLLASNPLLSHRVAMALTRGGLEPRGSIVRLVMTMRGGDRPKNAHKEFEDVTVMPRSMWEPWIVCRKPLEGRVQDNLRKWGTGGFRRSSKERPFGDVITSSPTHASERRLAPHPSLKPQTFMRQIVRGVLPMSQGIVLDPFCGSGSTLAACNALGYDSIGVEKDQEFFALAKTSIGKLQNYKSR